MKAALSGILVLVLMATAYLFGTFNAKKTISVPPVKWTEESDAALAWREMAVSLDAAGAKVFSATDDPLARLEGLQYMQDLLSGSLEMKASKGDPARPAFTDWMRDHRKFLGDSPDAVYHTAEISAEYGYEIRGNRGQSEYLGFVLYGRGLNGWNKAKARISDKDMAFDADGNFTLTLGGVQPNMGNWLPMEKDTHMVMVRQYFHDRLTKRDASVSIHNLQPASAQIRTEQTTANELRAATAFFNGSLDGTIALAAMIEVKPNSSEPPKAYNADFGGIFYPTEDNKYFGTWYDLADDEALILEGDVPDVNYWSVSLQNRWLQSLDYLNQNVSLHDQDIVTHDGRYRVVLASKNPGADNWLDTAGHQAGLLAVRYQLSPTVPSPSIRVVKIKDIK